MNVAESLINEQIGNDGRRRNGKGSDTPVIDTPHRAENGETFHERHLAFEAGMRSPELTATPSP
jgi:hypothetical protein